MVEASMAAADATQRVPGRRVPSVAAMLEGLASSLPAPRLWRDRQHFFTRATAVPVENNRHVIVSGPHFPAFFYAIRSVGAPEESTRRKELPGAAEKGANRSWQAECIFALISA
jgi:hypothetical protein